MLGVFYRILDVDEMTGSDYLKHLLLGCLDNLLTKLSMSDGDQGESLFQTFYTHFLLLLCSTVIVNWGF